MRDRVAASRPGGRTAGRVQALSGFGAADHACWAYSGDDRRAAAVTAWLTDGLRQEQRCLYVGDGTVAELASDLTALPGSDDAQRRGALVLAPSETVYDLTAPTDPQAQLAVYTAVLSQAIADGFRGICVVADITPLITSPDRRLSHVNWEQVADRYLLDKPISALCLYDSGLVSGIDAVVCAHPLRGPAATPLALYGITPDSGALDGEADATTGGLLADLLGQVPADDTALDLSALTFIDACCARILSDQLEARAAAGLPLKVTGATPTARRLWEVCGLDPALLDG